MTLSLPVRASSARSRRRFASCRRAAAVVVVLGASAGLASGGWAPAQAAASPGWRIERYLPGAGVENGLIFATSKSNAWTVATGKLGSLDLARWDGSRWQTVPTPANLAGSGVTAEALAGSAANNMWLFDGPIADTWTGSGWNQQVLTGLDPGLGVSAAAVSEAGVWAFGEAPGSGRPRALRLTSGKWTTVAMPGLVFRASEPSESDLWTLGVSRATEYKTISHWRMILMHWAKGSWHAVALPDARLSGGHPALALNFVALGPADVWAIAAATPNPCGCVAEPAGLLLEHWNGHRWTVTRLSKYSGVTGPVSDGHGGLWFASKRGRALLFVHVSNGKVTTSPVPRGHGKSLEIDGLATIPGTRSVWAAGSLPAHHGPAQTWPILKYGP